MSEETGPRPGDAMPDAAEPTVKPSMRQRLRPLELLGISAVLGLFGGLVTLFVMHPWGEFADQAMQSWITVLIAFGASFVVSLVVLAMLALGGYEPPKEPPSQILDRDDSPH